MTLFALEPRPSRADFCRGEVCTLCGAPAWAKVSEEPFASDEEKYPRHPLTAYVCQKDFDAIFRSYVAIALGQDSDDLRRRVVLAIVSLRSALGILSQARAAITSPSMQQLIEHEVADLARTIVRVDPLTETR